MKESKYKVWFEDGTGLETWAISPLHAYIKMANVRINNGENILPDTVEDEYGRDFEISLTQKQVT